MCWKPTALKGLRFPAQRQLIEMICSSSSLIKGQSYFILRKGRHGYILPSQMCPDSLLFPVFQSCANHQLASYLTGRYEGTFHLTVQLLIKKAPSVDISIPLVTSTCKFRWVNQTIGLFAELVPVGRPSAFTACTDKCDILHARATKKNKRKKHSSSQLKIFMQLTWPHLHSRGASVLKVSV